METSPGIKLALLVFLCNIFLSDADEVTTPNGKIVGSENLETRLGKKIFSFTGIPYAKPPVGPLRFKEPQPLDPWKEPLDATKDGSICPQSSYNLLQPVKGTEDCLNLNIYSTTLNPKAKLPVMFFIHGGGYVLGSGRRAIYGPEFLLDRDVVLVTVNYRLGILGFGSTGDDAIPGNLGLKDQSFALRWVHDNIENFGGDPNLVTVFGESAGGTSAHFSMLSPLSKGLVHRVISMSGTALCPWAVRPLQLIKDRTRAVATEAGCPTEPSDELLKCLQKVPLDVLVSAPRKFQDWLLTPVVIFGPVIEPETAKGAYLTADPSKIESKTPWITGFTSGEGSLFASLLSVAGGQHATVLKERPKSILPELLMLPLDFAKNDVPSVLDRIQKFYFGDEAIDKNTTEKFIELITDNWFMNGAIEGISRHSGDAWLYYYDYMQSESFNQVYGKGDIKNVSHMDILLNLYKIPHFFPNRIESEKDIMESKKIVELWTNFAKYGKPTENITALKWEPAGKGLEASKKYLYIGNEFVLKENLLLERVQFWNSLNEISLRKKAA